jgi:hypothetical protein
MSLQPFIGPWPLFQFLNLYTVSKTPWTGDQPLPTHRTTRNECSGIFMLQVEFASTIPVFERAKAVHVLGGEATVIG